VGQDVKETNWKQLAEFEPATYRVRVSML